MEEGNAQEGISDDTDTVVTANIATSVVVVVVIIADVVVVIVVVVIVVVDVVVVVVVFFATALLCSCSFALKPCFPVNEEYRRWRRC